ncbi:MAG: nucleotide sugar dehydrogenase [Armatimonadota bacterium]
MNERIAVIGLGYVGLPVALAFAREYPGTIGFDINEARVAELRENRDHTMEVSGEALAESTIHFTCDSEEIRDCTFFVVTVPTPVDESKQPDLTPVKKASETVGKVLIPGAVVVYESTVYPGVTEEICRPLLAEVSGLVPGADFFVGYSPERINPGDKEHTLETIMKVVSGENAETLDRVAEAYGKIVKAGVHRAPSIKVAEAAKVIENTQRDVNIALMNELALIFDRIGIATSDVLAAAGTKWNFLKFSPGLVGGHCIGVDPYYLTAKAQVLGYHPEVILSGRRINDGMGKFVAEKLIKLLIRNGSTVRGARVGVLGITFKENVPDVRNSRVPDIVHELKEFGMTVLVHDPDASSRETEAEYGIQLCAWDDLEDLDAVILAVPHREYLEKGCDWIAGMVRPGSVLFDIKSALNSEIVLQKCVYCSL